MANVDVPQDVGWVDELRDERRGKFLHFARRIFHAILACGFFQGVERDSPVWAVHTDPPHLEGWIVASRFSSLIAKSSYDLRS